MPPVLLSTQDLAKSFGPRDLFKGLRFGLFEGERTGLIGPNGAGKSTLLRILAGLEDADEGSVVRRKGLRLAYVPQVDGFEDPQASVRSLLEPSVAELPIDEGLQAVQLESALSQAGFEDPELPVGRLSGGWRKRLSILQGVLRDPDLLMLDEPSNHLDLEGVLWLEGLLDSLRFPFIVVTHDRRFLEQVCTRVMDLDRRYPEGIFSVDGPYSRFLEKREELFKAQQQQESSLANVVKTEIEWLRKGPKARSTKQQARIARAGELIEDLEDVKGRNAAGRAAAIGFSASDRQTRKLFELKGAVLERGGMRLAGPLDLILRPGDKLGLLGGNGSGKSSFLKLLSGELEAVEGIVKPAYQLQVVHFDQHREQLDPSWTLRRALSDGADHVQVGGQNIHVASWADRFLFKSDQLDRPLQRFSGGELARVLIARLMRQSADLLLLDEPTNDLDLASLQVLEQALLDFNGALVLVTHDRWLLDTVSDRLLALDGKGHADFFADLAQWQAHRDGAAQKGKAEAKAAAKAAREGSRKPALSTRERQDLAGMEAAIAAAEQELAQAQAALADPAIAMDAAALMQRQQGVDAAQAAIDKLFKRWEELEAKQKAAADGA
jgi:ATP-binding cassette subfamily F protein uup